MGKDHMSGVKNIKNKSMKVGMDVNNNYIHRDIHM